jgi:Glycerophosphoryl diester phosphodiesterase
VVEIIAHRGGAGAPENTLASFGWAAGKVHSAECDIDFSSDGHPVIIHDFTVDRTTDGTGDVTALTLAQLRALDAGSWFDARFAGTQIPTLDEFLEFCGPRFDALYPEFKRQCTGTQVNTVVDAIVARGLEDRTILTSFWASNFDLVRQRSHKVRVGYECQDANQWATNLPLAAADGNAVIICDYTLLLGDPSKVEDAHSRGVEIVVYVVNTRDAAEKLLALGVSRFITDYLITPRVAA